MKTTKPPDGPKRTTKKKSVHATWTTEEYLIDALAQLEAMVIEAQSKSHVAAIQAKTKAIQVREQLDQLREMQRETLSAELTDDEYRAELRTSLRKLRKGAAASGSHVATLHAIRLEGEQLEAAVAARRQAELDAQAAMSDADVMAAAARAAAELGLAKSADSAPAADVIEHEE